MKNPAWLVRSRRLVKDLRFWLVLTGYDPNDPSMTHKLYLVYAAIFWSLWLFATLTMVASSLTRLLPAAGVESRSEEVSRVAMFLVLAWNCLNFYLAARRSPCTFSEDDRYLVCQTPIPRARVVSAWFWGEAPGKLWPVALAAVLFGFIRTEAVLAGQVTWADFPAYFLAGWRSLAVLILFCLGGLALAWAYGCLRLKSASGRFPWLVAPALLAVYTGISLAPHTPALVALLAPLRFLIDSSLGIRPAWIALGAGGLGLAVALVLLQRAAGPARLVQAALETAGRDTGLASSFLANPFESQEIQTRRRLTQERQPSRLPLWSGWASLLRKDLLQTWRTFSLNDFTRYGMIAFIWGAAWTLQEPVSRLFIGMVWVLMVQQQTAHTLQTDLYHWRIFGLLPVSGIGLVGGEITVACLNCALATILGNLAAGWLYPQAHQLIMITLVPLLVVCAAGAGLFDLVRRTHSHQVNAGLVPGVELLGVVLGCGLVGAAGYPALWLLAHGYPDGLVWVSGLVFEGSAALLAFWLAAGQSRWMRTR